MALLSPDGEDLLSQLVRKLNQFLLLACAGFWLSHASDSLHATSRSRPGRALARLALISGVNPDHPKLIFQEMEVGREPPRGAFFPSKHSIPSIPSIPSFLRFSKTGFGFPKMAFSLSFGLTQTSFGFPETGFGFLFAVLEGRPPLPPFSQFLVKAAFFSAHP